MFDESRNKYCMRGLLTRKQRRHIKEKDRLDALVAVMWEQYLQNRMGLEDHEILADKYFEASRRNQYEALQRGIQYEREEITSTLNQTTRKSIEDLLKSSSNAAVAASGRSKTERRRKVAVARQA